MPAPNVIEIRHDVIFQSGPERLDQAASLELGIQSFYEFMIV